MPRSSLKQLHSIESLGNTPVMSGDIRVERIELRLQPRVPFPHRHDFYHLLFLERGSGWHEIDFHRHTVRAEQFFVMKPGEVHAWQLGTSTRGFVLEFTAASLPKSKAVSEILAKLADIPSMIIPTEPELFRGYFTLMHAAFVSKGADYQFRLECLLLAFLSQLLLVGTKQRFARHHTPLVERFLALVEKQFIREHSVEYYARELGVAPKSLTQQTSFRLSKSAGFVIHERLLIEAKRLLSYSDAPIAQIGYDLGFEDPNYFARFFRQRAGMPPGRYRKLSNRSVRG